MLCWSNWCSTVLVNGRECDGDRSLWGLSRAGRLGYVDLGQVDLLVQEGFYAKCDIQNNKNQPQRNGGAVSTQAVRDVAQWKESGDEREVIRVARRRDKDEVKRHHRDCGGASPEPRYFLFQVLGR